MKTARIITEIACEVDEKHFAFLGVLSDEETRSFWTKRFAEGKRPHCVATGEMGVGCQGCPFCTKFDIEIVED